MIVDAHLDLAYNAMLGRDVRLPARQQPAWNNQIATVGLPDLRAGGVGLVCATIFCPPREGCDDPDGYTTPDEARALALRQLAWYRSIIDEGLMRFVEDGALKIESGAESFTPHPQSAILLLEGADALRTPDDVPEWFDAGLRIVGLAWKRTRYAGGTGAPGPLTADGVALVRELDRFGIIHDASHLAEESFFQLLDLTDGPIIASHSNCRAIVPGDRHLSDQMIRALIARGGVVGINLFHKFLLPPDEHGKRRATLNDVVRHVNHICELAGNANHVGLGTDMDGGLGREQIPVEIQTSADLPRVGDALSASGFGDVDVNAIISENWTQFMQRSLPR
ncbi:MAG: dipeptidase [Tepidisphaeraceae bacterium]